MATRKLLRQGSFYQRGHVIRQSTLPVTATDAFLESEEDEEDEQAGGCPPCEGMFCASVVIALLRVVRV